MTNPIQLPTGAVVRVAAPRPPTTIAVPTQGPPGPPGEDGADLTPEERQAIVDDAEDAVLEELEPPVTLTVLFENSLI